MQEAQQTTRIVVVDDDRSTLQMLSTLLSSAGHNVYTAENGLEGIQKVREVVPDVVILDVVMPDIDGTVVCHTLKGDENTRHIPVICATGLNDTQVKLKCLEAGADEFLYKPIDPSELLLRVRNLNQYRKAEEIKKVNQDLLENQELLRKKNRELEEAMNEIKRVHSQMVQQEKMASIGQLAAGVAHEINNPIGFISSNLSTLLKYVDKFGRYIDLQSSAIRGMTGDGSCTKSMEKLEEEKRAMKLDYIREDISHLIRESLDGVERVKKIVQDLKSFSRVDEAETKMADINTGLESAINIVWNELKYKATVKKEYGELPMTLCNMGQLNQVFMNMLVNAAHAIEKQGEITVRTRYDGGNVYVSISDTGCGIPEDKIKRVFEPFYTTKEVGKGTGLGLSIAYDIVKKHNGEISVQSELHKGTTFVVRIPVAGEKKYA